LVTLTNRQLPLRNLILLKLTGISPQIKLIQDVSTRWNSTHDMLGSLIVNRSPINDVLENDNKCQHLHITVQEKEKMIELKNLLEPFKELTKMLGGENYVSSSIVIPTFCLLLNKVLKVSASDSRFIKEMKRKMSDDLTKRISKLKESEVLLKASALDPRFKKLKFLQTDALRDGVWTSLKAEIVLLRQEKKNREQQICEGNENDGGIENDCGVTNIDDPEPVKSFLDELESASSIGDTGKLKKTLVGTYIETCLFFRIHVLI
jgi:hypothetical protein